MSNIPYSIIYIAAPLAALCFGNVQADLLASPTNAKDLQKKKVLKVTDTKFSQIPIAGFLDNSKNVKKGPYLKNFYKNSIRCCVFDVHIKSNVLHKNYSKNSIKGIHFFNTYRFFKGGR